MADIIAPKELARRLSITPATLRKWVRAGIVPEIKVSATVRRFDFEAVVAALEKSSRSQNGGAQ